MNTNQEQIERVRHLLTQAQAVLATVDLARRPSPAGLFIPTLAANVDNEKLSDADFRQFVRNSLAAIPFSPPKSEQSPAHTQEVGTKPTKRIARKFPRAIVKRVPQ